MSSGKPLDLDEFEKLAYAGEHEKAANALVAILGGMEMEGWSMIPESSVERNDEDAVRRYITRFASAITALLCDPKMRITDKGFEVFNRYKRFMDDIFGSTTFTNMSHIMAAASKRNPDGTSVISNSSDLYKILVACSVESAPPELEQMLKTLPKNMRFSFWQSLLALDLVVSKSADDVRKSILKLSPVFENDEVSAPMFIRLVNVWMFVSYINEPTKHDVKESLNKVISRWAVKQGISAPTLPKNRVVSEKPSLLVMCEQFGSVHAMYRCYANAIEQLRGSYHLILMAGENCFDEKSALLFDEVISFNPGKEKLKKIIGRVVKRKPDVIFYPSIGMGLWSVVACNFRLAPIQLMSVGHPATSRSEYIDYLVVEEGFLGDPNTISETVVQARATSFSFVPFLQKDLYVEPNIRSNPHLIKIAVPSKSYKLNSDFIEICNRIIERSSIPVEFHFFPGMKGLSAFCARTKLQKLLPCVVYDVTDYNTYMANINQCDIQLSVFPFGNTNGFVDAVRQGIPVVCMDGPEIHSHIDVDLSTRVGLPDFCRTNDVEEYLEAILRLIENNEERVEISKTMLDSNIDKCLFEYESEEASVDFLSIMNWLFKNHEKIQEDGRHNWSVADRDAFDA